MHIEVCGGRGGGEDLCILRFAVREGGEDLCILRFEVGGEEERTCAY